MKKYRLFLIFAALLTAAFSPVLVELVRFALNSELFSYILLVPFISAYLIRTRKADIDGSEKGVRWPSAIAAAIGFGFLAFHGSPETILSCRILAYCCLLWSGGIYFLGMGNMRRLSFPAAFLVFMAPIPKSILAAMEEGLRAMSAETAYRFIHWSGIPVLRSGYDFHMPRISLSVAQECSGIRSTLVLFMTSLIAGRLFLRNVWLRSAFAFIVIPLGIARNAFRILVLAVLCVRFDTSFIDSAVHHQGGPLFFALSMIPFGLVLFGMRRLEKRGVK